MGPLEQHLAAKLQEREREGNLRSLSSQKLATDFFSNDYLGLVTTGLLQSYMDKEPCSEATPGSTGSRLLSGNNSMVEALEQTIAKFHGAEGALLFNSGYTANIGLITAIANRETTILYDELCHASIIDGIRLAITTKKYKFPHNDLASLADKLAKHKGIGPMLVIVESVYSMDGDEAPLPEMVALCQQYHAQLVVDEAHATGVVGNKGEGLVCALGLQNKVFARVHTFGKAMGCHGAAVVGSGLLKQYLINFSRPFIYTTALPGHAVQAIQCAYTYLSSPCFSNESLHGLISYFRQKIAVSNNPNWLDSTSPIQAFVIGDNLKSKAIAASLQAAGLQVKAILYPTVPLGKERLRVCLHSFNTKAEVDRLFEVVGSGG